MILRTVDLGYQTIGAGEINAKLKDEDGAFAKSKIKVQTHDIQLGVRYTF